MKAATLKQPKPEAVQCSEPRDWSGYAEHYIRSGRKKMEAKGWDPECCPLSATHTLDGRPYCWRHAGRRALEHLEERVK